MNKVLIAIALLLTGLVVWMAITDYRGQMTDKCGVALPVKLDGTFCMKRDVTGHILYTNGKIEVRILR